MKALSVKCAVCGKEFETERQLHGHLKAHKLRMAEYYQKYFKDFGFATPQYNLRDNSPNLQMGFNNDLDYFNFDYWNNVFPFWSPYNRFYYNRLYSFNRFSFATGLGLLNHKIVFGAFFIIFAQLFISLGVIL